MSDNAVSTGSESTSGETGGALVQTTECPNCGHIFTGDYCPSCGQEADPSTSAIGVVGGFFRELFDLESGFWPTLVGLTLRPGKILRRYLEGVRAGLASPGRYLLATVIISIGINQLLAWTGVGVDLFARSFEGSAGSSSASGDAAGELFVEAVFAALGQWIQVLGVQMWTLSTLLVAVFLAVLLYRLFGERLRQVGEALALGGFLSGHVELLDQGIRLLYSPVVFFYTGQPADSFLSLSLLIQVGYVGFVAHKCFGPGWGAALKGAFAGGWAVIEAMAITFMCLIGHAAWLALARPETHGLTGGGSGDIEAIFVVAEVLCALPLLLHAAVEAYSRLR